MLPEDTHKPLHQAATGGEASLESRYALLRHITDNVIGGRARFSGPFGEKQVVYCDYTASGKPLKFIEDFLTEKVYPFYANTHTETTITSKQTTQFRDEARTIIKQCTNCGEDDALIFTGSGSTGAIHKLINVMEMGEERARNTVVLVGPFEHHSNILPWKEIGAQVVRVRQTSEGLVDLEDIESKLKIYTKTHANVLGCFSAASNVTGIITDTHAVSALLHKYNALSFWDYATAAPYLDIDMNPAGYESGVDCSKDAVFVSTHKFVGGVQTPGILIAKKKLFINRVPHALGGGTVHYVSRNMHHYLTDIEAREEGGTPAIVESIRAGLAFQVKQAVGPDFIEERENELARRAFDRWQHNDNLIVLGNREVARLPIFSFLIRHPQTGKLLHHNFIAVLLNDLFGIQARGGCACAGPYAHDLLGISEENAMKFFELLREDRKHTCNEEPLEGVRPGFVRINLPYFAPDDIIDYVLTAVDLIATHGWKMLPQYHHDVKSGTWTHRSGNQSAHGPGYLSLFDIDYRKGSFQFQSTPAAGGSPAAVPSTFQRRPSLGDYLELAVEEFDKAESGYMAYESLHDEEVFLAEYQQFIWYLQPFEAASFLMALCWNDHDLMDADDHRDHDRDDPQQTACAVGDAYWPKADKHVHYTADEIATVPINTNATSKMTAKTIAMPIAPVSFARPPTQYFDDTAVVPDEEDSPLASVFQEQYNMYGSDAVPVNAHHDSGNCDGFLKPRYGHDVNFIKGIDDKACCPNVYDYDRATCPSGYAYSRSTCASGYNYGQATCPEGYDYRRAHSHESGYSTEEDVC